MGLQIQTDLKHVDWDRLADVYTAAFKGLQTGERIEKVFRRSYATRIARWNGLIVGGVYAFSDGELDATIHGLAVHPEYQRRGIGRALMMSLLEQFPPHIALLITAADKHHEFYRSLGFKRLHSAMGRGFPRSETEP